MYRIERTSRHRRTAHRSEFKFAWGARLAFAVPTGDWNDHPYEPIELYESGIGFDVEVGGWQRQVGYFLAFGGNKFDTSEHERYVSRQVGQFLDEDAGMLNLRAEVKTRIPTTGQITPIFKLGCGYYFMDSNSSYRSGNEFHPYDFFQDNWGVNAGVELMLKTTNGPRFYISADFINVFDVVRTSYNEDDLTMIKLGIGVTFINP